jgi:putative nucleotidyltransferase with HDIG domain
LITRDNALALVKKHVSNKNLIKHMLAAEAVMGKLARHLGENEAEWSMAGLLHDLDYDLTAENFAQHGLMTADILKTEDVPGTIIQAIKSHPGHFPRTSKIEKALYAADPVTGLIVAAALMHPDKKIKSVTLEFVERRFHEKRFAAGADRSQMQSCETFGIPLQEFIRLSLEAMQGIDRDLGL